MESSRNFFTRRILGEILASSLTQYMSMSDIDRVRSAFVSLTPGETTHSVYIELPLHSDGRRNIVAQLSLYWTLLRERVVDPEGNLWSYFKFTVLGSIRESFQLLDRQFEQRLLCLKELSALLEVFKDLGIPSEVAEQTHNNEQRIESEKIEKYFQTAKGLSEFFSSAEGRRFRCRLRVGGNPKKIPYECVANLLKDSNLGEIEFKLNDKRTNWCPIWKSYVLYVKARENFVYLYRV